MPFATDADLLRVYPGLSTSDPALRELMLEQAKCQFNECAWGCSLFLGHVYLTAHMITMASGGAATSGGKTVVGKSMGPVSVSYLAPSTSSSDGVYGETAAGRQYLAMRNALGPMPMGPEGFSCEDELPWGCC